MASLDKCTISFGGSRLPVGTLNGKTLTQLKKDILANGGQVVATVDQISGCTHMVINEEQYKKRAGKVHDAIQNDNVKIVSFDWLAAALESDKAVEEDQYLLHSRSPPSGSNSSNKKKKTNPKTAAKRKATSTAGSDIDDLPSAAENASVTKKLKSDPKTFTQNNKPLNIPLDDGVNSSYMVYIGEDGTIYDVTLNQTNAGHNANKFYRIQLLKDPRGRFWCWTRWGRVGEKGQNKMLGASDFDGAFREFSKKFRDKNGNSWEDRLGPLRAGKYAFLERNYEEDDTNDAEDGASSNGAGLKKEEESLKVVESQLSQPIQRLMKLIFNQDYMGNALKELDYDATRMPLGKLSRTTLLRGYEVLKDLATLIQSPMVGSAITEKSNQYFSIIPHDFGRNRPPVLSSMDRVKKEIEVLEALTDMKLTSDIMQSAKGDTADTVHILDRQYQGLKLKEMIALDPQEDEFKQLEDYLVKSAGVTHNIKYSVQDIFRIERDGEYARFNSSQFAKISNKDRRLLWHGSRCTNFGGILSQGLRIAPPEAPVSGYMFGKGIYLADMSTKSANYCRIESSGRTGLLLLCEAELGNPPLKCAYAEYSAAELATKQGSISTWGTGMTAPVAWKDAGCVHPSLKGVSMPDVASKPPGPQSGASGLLYNEYIVYNVAQVKLRYLLRWKMEC